MIWDFFFCVVNLKKDSSVHVYVVVPTEVSNLLVVTKKQAQLFKDDCQVSFIRILPEDIEQVSTHTILPSIPFITAHTMWMGWTGSRQVGQVTSKLCYLCTCFMSSAEILPYSASTVCITDPALLSVALLSLVMQIGSQKVFYTYRTYAKMCQSSLVFCGAAPD